MLTVKEIKSELKRLKIKGISGKNKAQLLAMLPKTGTGIGSWMKNAYNVITNPSKALTKKPKQIDDMMKKYGEQKVVEIFICRKPVEKYVKTLLNVVSMGKFNTEMKKYNYDDIYHLFCIMKLSNGEYLLAERNQRVSFRKATVNELNQAKDKVSIKADITVSDLFNKAIEAAGDNIWRYDAINNNCQNFISTLLKSSNLLNPTLDKFISQDVGNLLNNGSKKLSTSVTDFASLAENLIKGGARYGKGKKLSGGFIDEFVKSLLPPPKSNSGLFDSLKKLVKNPQETMLKAQGLLNDYNKFQDYQRQQSMKKIQAPSTISGSGRRKKKIKKVKFQ